MVVTNALWVYAHKISTALITLVSTPIILGNLGIEGYGIYSLTIGLVAIFGFINWSLTASTQRFITVGLVSEHEDQVSETFSTSFYIHLSYGLLLLAMISSVGYFFTESILDIPVDKIEVAKKVLLFVAVISFFQMIGIPFQGLLKAYENFRIVSMIGVLDSILKLLAAILLFVAPIDKLIFFSILMAVSALLIFLILFSYSKFQYPIVSLSLAKFNNRKFKGMMGFTSWNIIGAVAILGRNQGIGVVLNIFFGVVANAAYGVALQIQAALGVFSQGIVTAMTPKILKEAGKKEVKNMVNNAYLTAKYGLFVMSFVSIPLIVNMKDILDIWLKVVPENAVIFSQLIILFILSTGFSVGIQTIFHGINQVKLYNIYVSLILLVNIPFSILLFYLKCPPYSIFIISISLEIISFFIRLFLLRKYIEFNPNRYLKDLVVEVILPFFIAITAAYSIGEFISNNYIKIVGTSAVSTIALLSLFLLFSISSQEKIFFESSMKKLLKRN